MSRVRVNKANSRNNRKVADRYCLKCRRGFRNPSELQRHLKQTLLHNPSGARTFPCPLCPKMFAHRNGVTQHLGIHNREAEICGLPLDDKHSRTCDESFTKLSLMRDHMKDHLTQDSGKWLLAAYQYRFETLREKYGERRVTGTGQHTTVSKASTPLDSPPDAPPNPSTPVESSPAPTVQVLNASTMEHLGSECIFTQKIPNEAHFFKGKPQPSEAYRPRAKPADCDFAYRNHATPPNRAHHYLDLAASLAVMELVDANDMAFKSLPAPIYDNARPLSLTGYNVSQAPYRPYHHAAQAPSFPNAYMGQAQTLSNVYMAQAQTLPDAYTGQLQSLPNLAIPAEVPSLPGPHITQSSYSSNLPQPSLLSNSCYDKSLIFQDPGLSSSYMGAGALESLNEFTEPQNYQARFFPNTSFGSLQTPLFENQYFLGLNMAQPVTYMPTDPTIGSQYLGANQPVMTPYQTSWPNF